jgi:diguanylate cyclase (GGDEF)-like protein/PAS domain S-box-containing protein
MLHAEAISMPQHILLIQNQAIAAKNIIDALTHRGDESFQVEWVKLCSEGLQRLDGIDAIIVDLESPDTRGMGTFHRLFSAAPKIPILVLIDLPDESVGSLAVECGAQDYLLKTPLDAYQLSKTLRSMIARSAYSRTLFEEKERAQTTLNSIGDAVVSTDASGQVTYLNAVAEELTGWSQKDAAGHPLEDVFRIVDATTREIVRNPMIQAIRDNEAVALTPDCVLIRRDGVEAAIEDSAAPIHDRRGAVTGAVMVFHDVSAARATMLKMSHMARHDSLTDLPNRMLLSDRLNEAITLSSRYQRRLAILFLDLDHFKHINDSLGHVVGDRLLQSVARRLFTCVRSSDTVGRQGGDEFVVLLWEVRHAQDAAISAEKILEALRSPHHINGHELHISGSIGIVTYPDDGTDVETLMKRADTAMYDAKEAGRDTYQFFKPEMNARAIERQSLERSLHHAIERQELILHYQPKLGLATRDIIGVEALIRWDHPQRGRVSPGKFIAIAEDCGLIVPIGQWVLREACRQAYAWQAAGLLPLSIAINVSSTELRTSGFASGVREILLETGLEPHHLELEITERGLLENSRSVSDMLKELKDIGVMLTLDDFGKGYSSLSNLKRLPIDTLKIDRSFVRDLTVDKTGAGIVAAIIAMGRSLHIAVVAEGVETRQQLGILRQLGCPQGQGYYLGRPMPAESFRQSLESGATATVSFD